MTSIAEPTPELARRVDYERRRTYDEMGRVIGFSYHRTAFFATTAAKAGLIAANELAALDCYCSAYDRSVRSPTKSCLDVGADGGGGRGMPAELANATASMIDAKRRVWVCEAIVGANLRTMRGFVLDDRSFSKQAIKRFGGRDQEWIVDGHYRTKNLPRSGRHREKIRQEFIAGLHALTRRLEAQINMGGVQEIWIEPADARAFLRLGMYSPPWRFRLWGSRDEVAQLRDMIAGIYGTELRFGTAALAAARDALNAAKDKLRRPLLYLEDDELAA